MKTGKILLFLFCAAVLVSCGEKGLTERTATPAEAETEQATDSDAGSPAQAEISFKAATVSEAETATFSEAKTTVLSEEEICYNSGEELARNLLEQTVTGGKVSEPVSVEIFAGNASDPDAQYRYEGVMEILKPYLQNGSILVRSGQTEFEKVSEQPADLSGGKRRMQNILLAYYPKGTVLDAVLCPDAQAFSGIREAVREDYWDPENPPEIFDGTSGPGNTEKNGG